MPYKAVKSIRIASDVRLDSGIGDVHRDVNVCGAFT